MAECDFLLTCRFFNEAINDKAAVGEILKKRYCLGNNTECARLTVREKLGPAGVPATLWPNDTATAELLTKSA